MSGYDATPAATGDVSAPPAAEEPGRSQRRLEEQHRRRHHRAAVRDLERPGIAEIAQQCQVSRILCISFLLVISEKYGIPSLYVVMVASFPTFVEAIPGGPKKTFRTLKLYC